METLTAADRMELDPTPSPPLNHTRLVRWQTEPGNVGYYLEVLSWGRDNDTHGDALPFDEPPPDHGPYSKYIVWNQWLGEQLMYAASKGYLPLSGEEIAEFVAVANYAVHHPEELKATAVDKASLPPWPD